MNVEAIARDWAASAIGKKKVYAYILLHIFSEILTMHSKFQAVITLNGSKSDTSLREFFFVTNTWEIISYSYVHKL